MYQLRPELDDVLECLSLNGYSVFSLIDDILARSNWEDDRIKILREGMERDTAIYVLDYSVTSPLDLKRS
jgi:hypothetical protein